MLNLAWTELATESLQVLTGPDPGGPGDPAPFRNEGICPLVGARLSHGRG